MEDAMMEMKHSPTDPTAEGTAESAEAGEKKRILIVDDINIHLRRAKEILAPFYDLSFAKSGRAALELVNRTEFDVLLIDIEMPDMNGFELVERLKKMEYAARIVFVTAHASPEFVKSAIKLGVNDYLIKPFNTNILRERVANVLQNKR
jgi:putative two-component system response regulator